MASEYIYHWNRILGALALLVVLVGAGAYGVASLFLSDGELSEVVEPDSLPTARAVDAQASAPQSPEPAPPTAGEVSNVAVAPASPSSTGPGEEWVSEQASDAQTERDPDQMQVVVAPPETDPPAPVEEDAQEFAQPLEVAETVADNLEPGGPETGAPALDNPVNDPGEEASEPASFPTASVPTPVPVLSPGPEDRLLASADPVPERGTAASRIADQAPAPPAPRAVFEAGKTTLFSPAVQRFSLAKAIKNREPVADLQAVTFNENGLATAYAFSEVEGLMGSTIYYNWLHEGKKLAAVRVRVADERWRSHSSKYIEAEKTGAWTVQLRNAKGALLAQADFTLRLHDSSGGQ